MIYLIRFWFDFGGVCLWGMNEKAKERFGYAIDIETLNFSEDVRLELFDLQERYATYLDMSDPVAHSKWSTKEKSEFLNQSKSVFQRMRKELGSDFTLIFEVDENVKRHKE